MKIVRAERCRQNAGRKSALRATAALVVISALAGCSQMKHLHTPPYKLASSVEERHPIRVTNRSVSIKLPVASGAYGLTDRQRRRVRKFVAGYKKSGWSGKIAVAAPSGGANESATLNSLRDIRSIFRAHGVSRSAVDFRPYHRSSNSRPPIRMSYGRYVAEGPECGDWSRNVANDKYNEHYSNFGCASQKNLAAMIANPRDLVRPRGETPRDSSRRDVVFDKYIKGETTVSQKSDEESGAVSDVAK
ncbi:MAG: CpaD family pilus assembly protein [Methyloligellaceae bacterium]